MAETLSLTTLSRFTAESGVDWDNSTTRDKTFLPSSPRREREPFGEYAATTIQATEINADSSWLSDDLDRLQALRAIRVNWESGGAAPPNDAAIGAASRVLVRLSELDFRPQHIDPSTDEGVCISFRRGSKYADVECFNTGDIFAVTSKDDGGKDVWEVASGKTMDALERIYEFMNG